MVFGVAVMRAAAKLRLQEFDKLLTAQDEEEELAAGLQRKRSESGIAKLRDKWLQRSSGRVARRPWRRWRKGVLKAPVASMKTVTELMFENWGLGSSCRCGAVEDDGSFRRLGFRVGFV